MESELRHNLDRLASSFIEARRISPATLGKNAAGDWRFFARVKITPFTVRKYDAVVDWFAENWPTDRPWPADVPRPTSQEV